MQEVLPLEINVWDVGHGLAITLRMPNGDIHWIDLGKTEDFSPSEHMHDNYSVEKVKYLIITHPDKDHLSDLPMFIEKFGYPVALNRNSTIPEIERYGSGELDYQKVLKALETKLNIKVAWDQSPQNPENNGGIDIFTASNDYKEGEIDGNNASAVIFVKYSKFLFVCPGDLEPNGWEAFYASNEIEILNAIDNTDLRILVAPHHGRKSGYSEHMMEVLKPNAVVISDIWGDSDTHPSYYSKPVGITFTDREVRKYYSTKRGGRVRIEVTPTTRNISQV